MFDVNSNGDLMGTLQRGLRRRVARCPECRGEVSLCAVCELDYGVFIASAVCIAVAQSYLSAGEQPPERAKEAAAFVTLLVNTAGLMCCGKLWLAAVLREYAYDHAWEMGLAPRTDLPRGPAVSDDAYGLRIGHFLRDHECPQSSAIGASYVDGMASFGLTLADRGAN